MIDIYNANILDLMPDSLKQDEEVRALANAINSEIQAITSEIINTVMLPRIDELDDGVLTHLLAQFHITAEEGAGLVQTVEEKRELIKNAIKIHQIKGTKAALERVLELLNMRGVIKEWFEYNGDPYHFTIEILEVTTRGLDENAYSLLDKLVDAYKNTRSWLDAINIFLTGRGNMFHATTLQVGEEITVYPWAQTEIESAGKYTLGTAEQSIETVTIYPQ